MKNNKIFIYIFICLFVIALTYFIYFFQFDFFNTIDDRIQDIKFRFRGRVSPSNKVVMVEIDGKSIDKIGRWPWKRSILAKLIDEIDRLGAKTIVFDMVFSEYSDPKDDKIFASSIERSKKVVLGYFFRNKKKRKEIELANLNLPDFAIENIDLLENVDNIPLKDFPTAETNIPKIAKAAINKGFFSVFPDRDGILRRLHLLATFNGYLMPSLSLAAVSTFLHKDVFVTIDRYGIVDLKIGNKRIPVSNTGSILINFYGKGHTISSVSAIDILNNNVDKKLIEDKLVFIGVTEKAVGDMMPTPTDPNFPGTEVHCTMASNIIQNFYLVRNNSAYLIDILTILFVPIILTLISKISPNTFISLVVFSLFGTIYFVFNICLFTRYNIRISTIYPGFEFILCFVLLEVYRNFVIEQKSRYLKKAFSSYISKELVNEVLKSPDRLKLGGENKTITVLFLDIRDFTSISENLTPEDLVKLLNNFFGPVTDIILKNHGMLDKYIGDAIMALFNVPIDLPNHADAAIKSSYEIIKKLTDINKDFKTKNLPTIRIGIGINTGDAVVGNLGTKTRFDYTAIGDTVNLASRVEGLNKYFNTNVLFTEYTLNKITDKNFLFRYIGQVIVKGKTKPVKLYELITDLNILKEDIEYFEKGLDLLSRGNINESYKLFQSFYKKYEDEVSNYYINRIKKQGHIKGDLTVIQFSKK